MFGITGHSPRSPLPRSVSNRGLVGRAVLIALWLIVAPVLVILATARPALADEGWVVNSFDAQIEVVSDGSLRILETILADFGSQSKHGIFRDIPVVYDFGDNLDRVYRLDVASVKDAGGRSLKYEVSREGSYLRVKIGDANVTVSGAQTYRIAYTVRDALNGFADHDELYWNVNGQWPVRILRTAATVTLPGDGVRQAICYQGSVGSREACRFSNAARSAAFEATRPLPEDEQLTIVVAMPKGLVPEPRPQLERKPREFTEYFETTPLNVGGGLLALAMTFGALGWAWWRHGRDRHYTSVYYL
ncbi:MAG: DUF2207 domain-containing protein, partial [Chloroflexota bacterium]